MARKPLNFIDSTAMSQLLGRYGSATGRPEPSPGAWIKILRSYLRMTQDELAYHTKIAQSHLADIESGKVDSQLGTLRRIFNAMGCEVVLRPEPIKPIEEVLRGRARSVALKRLKQSMGSMALEKQAPDAKLFRELLEKRTDEILNDKQERLWSGEDE